MKTIEIINKEIVADNFDKIYSDTKSYHFEPCSLQNSRWQDHVGRFFNNEANKAFKSVATNQENLWDELSRQSNSFDLEKVCYKSQQGEILKCKK